jgi:hypothetical protein
MTHLYPTRRRRLTFVVAPNWAVLLSMVIVASVPASTGVRTASLAALDEGCPREDSALLSPRLSFKLDDVCVRITVTCA